MFITADDIRISALPLQILDERISSCLAAADPKLSSLSVILSELVDRLDREYVSPVSDNSLMSLYLCEDATRQSEAFISRLSDFIEEFSRLKRLVECQQRAVGAESIRGLVRLIEWKKLINLNLSLSELKFKKAAKPVTRPVSPSKSAVISKAVPPPLPFPVSSPGKAPPPAVPELPETPATCLSPGKAAAPPIRPKASTIVSKVTGPPPPPTYKHGKCPPPAVSVSRKASMMPPLLAASPVQEEIVELFPVPKLENGCAIMESRKLHWQSIPVSRFKNSIFETLIYESQSRAYIDFDLVKSHFVKDNSSRSPKGSTSVPPTAVCTPVQSTTVPLVRLLPSVLDMKRIQQIEIFLNGNKGLTSAQIRDLARTGGRDSDNRKNMELIEGILTIFPSDDETNLIKAQEAKLALSEERVGLPKADLFLLHLLQIPQVKIALNYITVYYSADEILDEAEKYLSGFIEFVDRLLVCDAFVEFVRIIGSFVVYLSNGKKMNFNGFSVELIPQLKKVQSYIDKDYTIFDCSVSTLGSRSRPLSDVLKLVVPLIDFEFADIILRFENASTSVDSISVENLEGNFYAEFIPILSAFKSRMQNRIEAVRVSKSRAVASSSALRTYLAESDKRCVDEILVWMHAFNSDIENSKKKIAKFSIQKVQ